MPLHAAACCTGETATRPADNAINYRVLDLAV
jgi:hypothetical protein